MMPDMLKEQPGNSCGIYNCGYSVDLLRQAIHHHKDGIVSLWVWEFSDHIYGDHLPALVWDLVGDQLSHFLQATS